MAGLEITAIPDTILLKVFALLPLNDKCLGVRQTCWKWHDLSYDRSLWKSLDFRGREWSTTDQILINALQKTNDHVQSLNFSGCHRMTNVGFVHDGIFCPNLQSLDVSDTNISLVGLFDIVNKYPQLQYLKCHDCEEVTIHRQVLQKLPNLRGYFGTLMLPEFNREQNIFIVGLLSAITSLTELHIYETPHLYDEDLELIGGNLLLTDLSLNGCSSIGDEGIKYLWSSIANLTSLDLSGTSVTDKSMKLVASICTSLVDLNVSACRSVTDIGLVEVSKNCPSFCRLTVNDDPSSTGSMTDVGLRLLAEHCPNLELLRISSCPQVTDIGIKEIALHCTKLSELDVSHCLGVTDVALKFLGGGCINLLKLDASSCVQLTAVGINDVLKGCRHLQIINTPTCHYLKNFCHIQNLPRESRNTAVTHMDTVADETSPKELQSCADGQDPDKDDDTVANQATGDELWLCAKTGQFVARANSTNSNPENHEHKHITKDQQESTNGVKVPPSPVSYVKPSEIIHLRITTIDLAFCSHIANNSLKNIGNHCPCLTDVSFRGCYFITDVGVTYLSEKCRRLKKLDVSGGSAFGPSRLTDGAFKALAKNSRQLEELCAEFVHSMTLDSVVELLSKCKRLRQLSVSASKAMELCKIIDHVKTIRGNFWLPNQHAYEALSKNSFYNGQIQIYCCQLR